MTVAIRTLRRSRALTLTDIALLTGIPVRTIAEIEHGLRQCDRETAALLAVVFGLAPDALQRRLTGAQTAPPGAASRLALLAAGTLTVAAISAPWLGSQAVPEIAPAPAEPRWLPQAQPTREQRNADGWPYLNLPASPALAGRNRIAGPTAELAQPSFNRAVLPEALAPIPAGGMASGRVALMTPVPTVVPAPAFVLLADGPHGCPLPVSGGQVVITQGYGVGSHAPARVWGALDLAVDADGDGVPEPGSSAGATVVATHDGMARVYPGTWPGGNVVMVEARAAGWVTLYAHLSAFSVADGQAVTAGTPVGLVGSTGQSSGPHLHYEVRGRDGNVDPAELIGC